MRIFNIMLSKKQGGIEQACIDYTRALLHAGHEVYTIIHPKAPILPQLEPYGSTIIFLPNRGKWDIWARFRLRRLVQRYRPDLLLCHANRATALAKPLMPQLPVVAVAHNYLTTTLIGCTAILAITKHVRNHLLSQGQPPGQVLVMPNMIDLASIPSSPFTWQPVPTIGVMSRLVKKKGVHRLIEAAALLKSRGLSFKIVIAGTGPEQDLLADMVQAYQLQDTITFSGWVKDKTSFYQSIDIFCLPSLHEPFGIVVLEAWAHGKPMVVTNAEGPEEIVTPEADGIMVEKDNAASLAEGLARLLLSPALARELRSHGLATVQHYSLPASAERLSHHLERIHSHIRN